jgi:hypothetical protein
VLFFLGQEGVKNSLPSFGGVREVIQSSDHSVSFD